MTARGRLLLAGTAFFGVAIVAFALLRARKPPVHPRTVEPFAARAPAPSSSNAERVEERARAEAMRRRLRNIFAAKEKPRSMGSAGGAAPVGSRRTGGTGGALAERLPARRADVPGVAPAPEPTAMPAPDGSGNQAEHALGRYIKDIVREQFAPMAGGCYEEYLSRHPGSAGKLVLSVRLIGDRSVGTVVDSVDLADGSTLNDPEMSTCITESMMSLAFAPPPPGHDGEIQFVYPFNFGPDPPGGQRGDTPSP